MKRIRLGRRAFGLAVASGAALLGLFSHTPFTRMARRPRGVSAKGSTALGSLAGVDLRKFYQRG